MARTKKCDVTIPVKDARPAHVRDKTYLLRPLASRLPNGSVSFDADGRVSVALRDCPTLTIDRATAKLLRDRLDEALDDWGRRGVTLGRSATRSPARATARSAVRRAKKAKTKKKGRARR